jgi:hypothetical protein
MKTTLKTLRLILSAAEAEAAKVEIAPEYLPQIAQARADILTLRGVDVVEALIQRGGLSLTFDMRSRERIGGEKSQRPPGHQ